MKKNKSINVLIALALSASLISACGSDKKEKEQQLQTEKEEAAVDTPAVVLAPVNKGKLNSSISIPGELIPYQQVDLYAKINSFVKKLLVDVGSEVHQGQLLAVMEAPEINSQLSQAESRIKQMESIYLASKATYDRLYITSKTPGTVSANDLEQADAKKNSDYANVEAAKSSYAEYAANLNYLQIKAPFDGVITARNVNTGAYVGPGGKSTDPLFTLQDQKRLRLAISVPEAFSGNLNKGETVSFNVKAFPNKKFTAQVERMAGALDEKLRSEYVEMDVYNKDKSLLPHMYAEVNLPLPAHDSTLIVPKTAVVSSTESVFVVKIVDHHAEWVYVKKGFESGGMVEVYGKLTAGDKVVKKATDEIRNGSAVKY
ncbi:MAG TPA: efflux RND transporter periplasmic adaptor subunit [Mucilaginibacter sp.]|jgi:RND family efflux transporter MFP subunit